MLVSQEPKYDCTPDGQIVNRSTHRVIPPDEPIIILRAKDLHALGALRTYLALCQNADHRAVVKSRVLDFEAFAAAHPDRMKEPDSSQKDLAGANVGRAPFSDTQPAAARTVPSVERVPGWPFPDGSAT